MRVGFQTGILGDEPVDYRFIGRQNFRPDERDRLADLGI
jgi:hypothetical protein